MGKGLLSPKKQAMETGLSVDQAMMDVIIEQCGALGRIRLNRPKALNSLTHGMTLAIASALEEFARNPTIAAVLLTGEGERGLCAGGDIRVLYEARAQGGHGGVAARFWRDEYRVNARIAHFPKPFIAILDGITMGGGVGLAAHAAHRVVTERSRIAMPEVTIGFLPDVGGTWLLSRAPGELGTYLGMTGDSFGPQDALLTGFADVELPVQALSGLLDDLTQARPGITGDEIRRLLAGRATPSGSPPLQERRKCIDAVFAGDTVEGILAALAAEGSPFALETLTLIQTKSPTSVKLTLRLLRLARASSSLEECLEREFSAGVTLTTRDDFYEGVRAAIVDKDRKPRWSPAASDAEIESWLGPAQDRVFP